MKFKFSLASVLKVREHQEKIQKQKLAREVAKKEKINKLRTDVQEKLENYLQSSKSRDVENIHSIKRHMKHVEQVHQKMEEMGKQLNKAEISVDKEREKLAAAHKKLHIMEKVREFEQALFSEKMARDEQKVMDEIATQTFDR